MKFDGQMVGWVSALPPPPGPLLTGMEIYRPLDEVASVA